MQEGATTSSGWIGSPDDYKRYDEGQKQFANGILSAVKAEAGKLGISANTIHVPNEHPATAILAAAASLDCNLIVMASTLGLRPRPIVLASADREAA